MEFVKKKLSIKLRCTVAKHGEWGTGKSCATTGPWAAKQV